MVLRAPTNGAQSVVDDGSVNRLRYQNASNYILGETGPFHNIYAIDSKMYEVE